MPYRPSRRQLEYLLALAETGHFGRAAKACHVSQPSLSVQIQLLEEQLGVALFDRTPGRILPTPMGERVIAAARQVLSGLDDIVALAASGASNLGGTVRLGVVPTFGPYLLPRMLPEIHERYVDLKIYIREDRPRFLEEAVARGEIDCAIAPAIGEMADFMFRPICRERILLGVGRGHRLYGSERVHVSDLRGERLLTLGRGHRLLDNVRELAAASGAILAEDYEGTSLDALRQMVSIDMGLSLFPELYIRSEFRGETDVRLLTLDGIRADRDIGFLWRRSSARQSHFETLAGIGETVARQILSEPHSLFVN